MGNDITLSSSVRTNLVSLQGTADLLARTQEKLATGNRVNSALDDPTAFFTAVSLNNRASDLSSLLDNAGQGVQTLKAAESGIEAISDLLDSAKSVLVQAKEKSITASSQTYTLAGTADDTTAFGAANAADDVTYQFQTTEHDGSVTDQSVTIASGTSRADAVSQINDLNNISATYNATDNTVTISQDHARAVTTSLTTTGTDTLAADIAAGTNDRDAYISTFNELLTQIDQISADASYKGINLLKSDELTVYFNEDQTSSLKIEGVNLTTTGDLSINDINALDVSTDATLENRLSDVDSAQTTLRNQSSTFGANLSVVEVRTDFTESLINTLEEGSGLLTLADTNEEGANLLALQTRQQLSSVSLSLASQADQAVLRLF